MQTSSIPLFSLLTNRMSWLSTRQAVLSENVANADTPNYHARDLKPVDFETAMSGESSSGLSVTNTRHITARFQDNPIAEPEDATGEGGTPSGNVVSVEQEMIKLSDTQLQYQTATNIYQKTFNMFRTALGNGS